MVFVHLYLINDKCSDTSSGTSCHLPFAREGIVTLRVTIYPLKGKALLQYLLHDIAEIKCSEVILGGLGPADHLYTAVLVEQELLGP